MKIIINQTPSYSCHSETLLLQERTQPSGGGVGWILSGLTQVTVQPSTGRIDGRRMVCDYPSNYKTFTYTKSGATACYSVGITAVLSNRSDFAIAPPMAWEFTPSHTNYSFNLNIAPVGAPTQTGSCSYSMPPTVFSFWTNLYRIRN